MQAPYTILLGAKHSLSMTKESMAGDLPNIYANAQGEVELDLLSPFVTLNREAEIRIWYVTEHQHHLREGGRLVVRSRRQYGARIGCGCLIVAKGGN